MPKSTQDRASYDEVFNTQSEKLRRMAFLFLHDPAAAEDAVQETYVRGLSRLKTFKGESRFDVWLYSIALNVCRRAYRRNRLQKASLETQELKGMRGPLTSAIRRETSTQLAIALGFLTALQREVFVLHYVEGLPYEALAPMLEISVVGARGLAHRAKRLLKTKLPEDFEIPLNP